MSFLTKKKRLRQAASRGKWCFSLRNAILGNKSRVEKKLVSNFHFWAKSACHFDDLQSNLFFPRSIRIDFSRSVIFNLVRRVLQEEIHFFVRKTKKIQLFPTKKRQNRSKLEKSPSGSKSGPTKKFRMTFFIHRSSGYWILNTKSSIFNMIRFF